MSASSGRVLRKFTRVQMPEGSRSHPLDVVLRGSVKKPLRGVALASTSGYAFSRGANLSNSARCARSLPASDVVRASYPPASSLNETESARESVRRAVGIKRDKWAWRRRHPAAPF